MAAVPALANSRRAVSIRLKSGLDRSRKHVDAVNGSLPRGLLADREVVEDHDIARAERPDEGLAQVRENGGLPIGSPQDHRPRGSALITVCICQWPQRGVAEAQARLTSAVDRGDRS